MPETTSPPDSSHVRLGSNAGQPMTRRDGILKVTGAAPYAADAHRAGLLHAVCAVSAIARGRVTSLDIAAAQAHPGVVHVMTPGNRPPLARHPDEKPTMFSWRMEALQDDRVRYAGQPIALVVAETLEAATEGTRLLAPVYDVEVTRIGFDAGVPSSPRPSASATRRTSPRGMLLPVWPPPRSGPRRRSRRRSSITTPWNRTPSSRAGRATA